MDQADPNRTPAEQLWLRIVDFPLVAMVIAVLLFLFAAGAGQLLVRQVRDLTETGSVALAALVEIALVLIVYKGVLVHLGERPRDDLRLPGAARNLGLGLLTGVLLMASAVGIAAIAGVYRIVATGDASRLAFELFGSAILSGFLEETLFRGILFRWFEEFAGSWAALPVTAALFGLVHIMNPNATWFSTFAIAVEAGLLFGGAYMLTRSLWLPIGLHAAWNFTQGEIFDVPVSGLSEHGLLEAKLSGPALLSGGGFGLEASVICLVLASATGIWFVWRAVKTGELVQPWWIGRRQAV
jgi:membrane protease YdiL (CAAX protease family)